MTEAQTPQGVGGDLGRARPAPRAALWTERASVSVRILGWSDVVLTALILNMGIWFAVREAEPLGWVVAAVAVLGLAFTVGALLLPKVEATGAGLQVRNILFRYDIPWTEILDARGDYRTIVSTADGEFIFCWAIQRANVPHPPAHPSRTESVADRIVQTRDGLVGPGPHPRVAAVRRRVEPLPVGVWAAIGAWAIFSVAASVL